uniref:Si:dkey-146m20.13 n=1 Tax=Paramormyrops kingsleyae TaxID=1676925 RepID=A0A3B3R3G9_9TELE
MIDSFAMAKVWQGSYNILRKWNPKEYQMVLGVIGEHGHWTLAAMYPSQKKQFFIHLENQRKRSPDALTQQ